MNDILMRRHILINKCEALKYATSNGIDEHMEIICVIWWH